MEITVPKKQVATVKIEQEDGTFQSYKLRKPTVAEQDQYSIEYDKARDDAEKQIELTRNYLTQLGIEREVIDKLDVHQADATYDRDWETVGFQSLKL